MASETVKEDPSKCASVLEAARRYHEMGLNVIPIAYGTKKPTIKWEKYQRTRVTLAEIEEWFGNTEQPVNIAIICGSASGNFVVFDFDSRENYAKFFPNPQQVENETPVVETARGIHVWYRSFNETPKFKVPGLVDVQGEGGYVLAPPSIHPSGAKYTFKKADFEEPLLVDNAEESVWKRAKELGVERDVVSFLVDAEDPACVRAALRGVQKGLRNEAGIRLAAYWLYWRHETRETAWDLLRAWNKRNKTEPLPETELRSIMKSALRGGKAAEYGCNAWRQIGETFCTTKIAKECRFSKTFQVKSFQIKQVGSAVLSDGRLIEEGYDGETAYFIVYDHRAGQVSRVERIHDEEAKVQYEPLLNTDVETFQVLLPTEAVDYGNDQQLLDDLIAFMNRWHEQPNVNERVLDGLYAFMTYMKDLLPQVCYRRALGEWGTAKSTFVETLGSVCYRPFYTAGCSSEAALRRTFDLWRGTALVDEADFAKRSDLFATVMRVMNIGFDSRFGWYRCCDETDPSKVLSFYVFGPKILATRKRFADPALESRCQTFIAEENRSPVPLFRLRHFTEEALSLRNKLLMWRFKNYHAFKEQIDATIEDPKAYERLYGKDTKISSRIKQITFPLSLVAGAELRDVIKTFAQQHDADLKALDESRLLGAQIEDAVKSVVEEWRKAPETPKLSKVLEGGLEVRTSDLARLILGEPELQEDKVYLAEYRRELKVKTREVNDYLNRTQLRPKGHSDRYKYVTLPWGLPIEFRDFRTFGQQHPDFEVELQFPFKIALKARKEPGQQKLSGPTEKESVA